MLAPFAVECDEKIVEVYVFEVEGKPLGDSAPGIE